MSASTPHQARWAVVLLSRHVLGQHVGWWEDVVRATRPQRLPVVLTRPAVSAWRGARDGVHWSLARLLSGAGRRRLACRRLRVQDMDVASQQMLLRAGKGHQDRRTRLPPAGQAPLAAHRDHVRHRHQSEVAPGVGQVSMPDARPRQDPHASSAWGWQWGFPAAQISLDPRSGEHRRHYVHASVFQRAVKAATRTAGVAQAVNGHTRRHSFATQRQEDGDDLRTRQALRGPRDVQTTMRETHVLHRGGPGVYSPMDRL